MGYIAHIRESDQQIQLLKHHLLETRDIAEHYGAKLGIKHVAGLAGLLHDVGKYSDEFQTYIYEAVFEPENTTYKRGDVDHSTAGGKMLYEMLHQPNNTPHEKLLSEIVCNVIISHHGDLKDYLSTNIESPFLHRVQNKEVHSYEQVKKRFYKDTISYESFKEYLGLAVGEFILISKNLDNKSIVMLTKFIFSCLIDADRTNTREFENPVTSEISYSTSFLYQDYYSKLMDYLNDLKKNGKPTAINLLRQQMSEQCDQIAKKPAGVYSLSIPTGGGKTLASLRYALKHSLEYQKRRIIYVVPFTTIIEQNAEEVRTILQEEEHILEHHSNVVMDERELENDEMEDGIINKKLKLQLAKDNWDSPIIFTTMVQFLNVFFAKGNRNTRRMHNLINSVIIFDEVQKVPTKCISLFNEAVNFLNKHGNSSILLCTATQPTLENVQFPLIKQSNSEIVQDLNHVSEAFKRVEVIDQTKDSITNEQLQEWLLNDIESLGSTLIILNTKSVVRDLYDSLKSCLDVPVFHLSTSMCAAHRKRELEEIRDYLAQKMPFVCVTTQLIEAGVDVSFDCVIRSLSGLDSIAQAAGRCNRHGEYELKQVYVINHKQEKLSNLKEIEVGKEISKNLLARYRKKPEKYDNNLLSPKAMREYFLHFYESRNSDLNYFVTEIRDNLMSILMEARGEEVNSFYRKNGFKYPLMLRSGLNTTAKYFRVIDESTTSLLVPYSRGKEIIAELNSKENTDDLSRLLKDIQQYTIQVYPQVFRELINENGLIDHFDGMIYELKSHFYSEDYGLELEGRADFDDMII